MTAPDVDPSLTFDALWEREMVLEWVNPHDLAPHPMNPRRHPTTQRLLLSDSLDQLGWLSPCIGNRRTKRLIDGHMRRQQAIERNEATIPILWLDLDEQQEAAALAIINSISAQAVVDKALSAALVASIPEDLADIAQRSLLVEQDRLQRAAAAANEVPTDTADSGKTPLRVGLVPGEQYNYVMLLFRTPIDWLAAQHHFGLEPVLDPFRPGAAPKLSRVVDGAQYLRRVGGYEVPDHHPELQPGEATPFPPPS